MYYVENFIKVYKDTYSKLPILDSDSLQGIRKSLTHSNNVRTLLSITTTKGVFTISENALMILKTKDAYYVVLKEDYDIIEFPLREVSSMIHLPLRAVVPRNDYKLDVALLEEASPPHLSPVSNPRYYDKIAERIEIPDGFIKRFFRSRRWARRLFEMDYLPCSKMVHRMPTPKEVWGRKRYYLEQAEKAERKFQKNKRIYDFKLKLFSKKFKDTIEKAKPPATIGIGQRESYAQLDQALPHIDTPYALEA